MEQLEKIVKIVGPLKIPYIYDFPIEGWRIPRGLLKKPEKPKVIKVYKAIDITCHGTTGYRYGCRCLECRNAKSMDRKRYRELHNR